MKEGAKNTIQLNDNYETTGAANSWQQVYL